MIPKQIIKSCLRNVMRACKRYGVSFNEILKELVDDQLRKESNEGKRHGNKKL